VRTWLEIIDAGLTKLVTDAVDEFDSGFYDDQEDEGEAFDFASEHIYHYRYDAAVFPYEYFLVCCFAQFELQLTETCRRFCRIKGTEFSLKGLRGSYVEKCRTFVKRTLCLPFPDDTQVWPDLVAIGRLRNCIVHRGGDTRGAPGELQIVSLKKRVMADMDELTSEERDTLAGLHAFDEELEEDLAISKALCHVALRSWRQFSREFASRLHVHFGYAS
jgi:hypothetical protein